MSVARTRTGGRVLRLAAIAASSLALAVSHPARAAGDDPGATLKAKWTAATDPEREALLKALTAAPSADAFGAARDAAKSALDVLAQARHYLRNLEEYLAGQPPSDGKARGADPFARDRKAAADLERQVVRETNGLARLADAAGTALDALPDADFSKLAASALREVPREDRLGYADWVASAVGAAAKDRTPPLLLDVAAEALKDQRKAVADRAAPAKKLEDVNEKIAKALEDYLKKAYAAGDYSGNVPAALVATLLDQKEALDREVTKVQRLVEGADQERRAAGRALARWLAAADATAAAKGMDLVERRCLADSDLDVRALGFVVLAPVPGPRAYAHLKAATAESDPRVVVEALLALAERDEPDAVATLAARLSDERWRVRAAAAEALGRSGRAAAVRPLVDALSGAKGRELDDLRAALVALTGKGFPAAAGPWASWWDAEGKDFRGARDPRPAGAPKGKDAGGPVVESFPDEGGVAFYGIQTHSARVLLVLDVSGSMNFPGSDKDQGKKKIDVLREEVKKTLTGLPDGAVFGLIAFSTTVQVWKKDPQTRGAKTVADAIDWFGKTQAIGSTNIHDALETAFRLMGQGTSKDKTSEPVYDTVFLMTDGRPTSGKVTDPRLILGEVKRWNEARKVRIHVVGVGGHGKNLGGPAADDIDPQFLKDLAEQNGGQCVIR